MEEWLEIVVTQEDQPHPFIPEDFVETTEEVILIFLLYFLLFLVLLNFFPALNYFQINVMAPFSFSLIYQLLVFQNPLKYFSFYCISQNRPSSGSPSWSRDCLSHPQRFNTSWSCWASQVIKFCFFYFFSRLFYKSLARSSRLLILTQSPFTHLLSIPMFPFFLVTADATEASKWLWTTSQHCSESAIMGGEDQLLNATHLASLQLGVEDPTMTVAQ